MGLQVAAPAGRGVRRSWLALALSVLLLAAGIAELRAVCSYWASGSCQNYVPTTQPVCDAAGQACVSRYVMGQWYACCTPPAGSRCCQYLVQHTHCGQGQPNCPEGDNYVFRPPFHSTMACTGTSCS